MLKRIKNIKIGGFSGLTHWLIAIFLFLLMWKFPSNFSKLYTNAIAKNGYLFLFIHFLVLGGASLLPDLDSSPLQEGGSTAVYQLGIIGYWISIVFIVISGSIYSIFRTKADQKPKSQHRMFWHSLIPPIIIFLYSHFNISSNSKSFIDSKNMSYIFILIIAIICIYLGSCMFFYKVMSLIRKGHMTQSISIITVLILAYIMANMNGSEIKLIAMSISLGYAFHMLPGDIITKGGAPIFFPIPLKEKGKWVLWKKICLPSHSLAITTGGMINIVINFILIFVNIFLFWSIFLS